MQQFTRRNFLATTAGALTAPLFLPSKALGRGGSVAPNEKIAIGSIGLGSRGSDHLRTLLPRSDVQVIAVCDVFRSKAEKAQQKVAEHYGAPGCKAYQDFREMLARPDLDAVVIAAPENWHAIMSLAALKAGKDVYCEKALSLTVAEGRAVCDAVARHGRVFQAGTQQRSDRNFRFACELARNGYLGKLQTVTVGVPSGKRVLHLPVTPPPADLDYDLWLGPAPFKPHRDNLCTYNWYFLTDYCAGWIQSWGVHHMDIGLWGAPALTASTLAVEGTAEFLTEGDADVSFGWAVKLTTPDGLQLQFHDDASSPVGHGCRFTGDRGWVHVTRGGIKAEPAELLQTVLKPADEHLYVSREHQTNFLECIRSRREPVAPARVCHAATTATLVADIATRLGRKLTWNWKSERFVGDSAADRLLNRTMRSPWQV
jgi:hypothetical protein